VLSIHLFISTSQFLVRICSVTADNLQSNYQLLSFHQFVTHVTPVSGPYRCSNTDLDYTACFFEDQRLLGYSCALGEYPNHADTIDTTDILHKLTRISTWKKTDSKNK